MLRCCRVVLAIVVACAVAVGLVVVAPSTAGAATHHAKTSKHKHKKKAKKPAKPPKPVTLAPGVVVKYYNVKITKKRVVRTALLRFDMRNRHIRLDATMPRGLVGAGRQTITAQTRALRAVGGINADFFNLSEPGGTPNGGVVVNGVLVKSPRKNWDANLYVRGGRARIGALAFTATVTRAARPAPPAPPASDPTLPVLGPQPKPTPATSRAVSSVNSLKDLGSDKIVLVTSAMASARLRRACTVVVAVPARTGGYRVAGTYPKTTSLRRLGGRTIALAACGIGKRAIWLATKIVVGDSISVASAIAGGTPSTLVSGGQVLVRGGRGFADRDGKTITGRNPETFGCVSRGGTKVILGTVDGRREGSSGVTIPELRKYLLRLHCYNGIVFDGGGSSTLVGRPVGRAGVHVLNRPSDRGGARAVTSGLVLHRR